MLLGTLNLIQLAGILMAYDSGWTVFHSIAFVLLGASLVHGDIAEIEIQGILLKLTEYSELGSESANLVLAQTHGHLTVVLDKGGLESWTNVKLLPTANWNR
jgi:hypothetical protein